MSNVKAPSPDDARTIESVLWDAHVAEAALDRAGPEDQTASKRDSRARDRLRALIARAVEPAEWIVRVGEFYVAYGHQVDGLLIVPMDEVVTLTDGTRGG